VVATLELFRDLPQAALDRLTPQLFRKVFPVRSTIMAADQRGEAVYFILSGTVRVHVERADGEDVVIAILGPGEMVGEMSLLDGRGRSASVTTLDKTECLWMDGAAFRDALRTMPELGFQFARILAARIRMANDHIQALAALDVESRVARQLVALADRYGQPNKDGAILIPIRLTQADLSATIAASREQTNKVLVSYRTRGAIEVSADHRITILKPEWLEKRAGR
jgi:CRP/FNR family cyclic AMP-dependent transcriptional regulator